MIFTFFQLDGCQHGGMAYIIWNYTNLSTKWCIKPLPVLNLNNTTDLFLGVAYQLSLINTANGMLLLRSEWKKKKSCNKNAIKNTEMLENYIYCIPIKFSNISVFFINFLWKIFHKPIVLVVLTTANFGGVQQCGKPFFPNTRQNGEWTETITHQYEKELAMLGEWHFF